MKRTPIQNGSRRALPAIPRAFVAIVSLIATFPAVGGATYEIRTIPPLANELSSSATDINNKGHVVGIWTHAQTFELRGYYFDGAIKHDLGVGVQPQAMSDDGWVTGIMSGQAFRYEHATGNLELLGTLGGSSSSGAAINKLGQVAGVSDMPGSEPDHAFLYSDGTMYDLGTPTNLGGLYPDYTKANGINDAGRIVGEALVWSGGEAWAVPFLYDWPSGSMLKIDGTYSSGSAWAMNEAGHVVGWTSTNIETWGKGFLYDGQTWTGLGTLPGKSYTIATDVNNLDRIVGYAFGEWVWYDCCGWLWTNNIHRAFLWRDGSILDMNDLIEPGGNTLATPIAINDSGKILIAYGGQSVVLAPVVFGDPNDDGYLDLADYAMLVDCLGGPNAEPEPTLPTLAPECIQWFDDDFDYDVDSHDLARFEIRRTNPGRITGEVKYTGPQSGMIHVVAADVDPSGFTYDTIIADAGTFEINLWRTGDYQVSAFLDVNGNGEWNTGEPTASALGGSFHVEGEAGLVEQVLINLGPYSVGGFVGYDSGSGVGGVTITMTGPVTDSILTLPDGTYLLTDLPDGSYVATPSAPMMYFYPYDAPVTLSGADVFDIDFEAHDFPAGEVDGELSGIVHAVDLQQYSITVNVEGALTTVYVYAGTTYTGFAASLEQVTVGHNVEAQFYTSPVNLAVQIDTDP